MKVLTCEESSLVSGGLKNSDAEEFGKEVGGAIVKIATGIALVLVFI